MRVYYIFKIKKEFVSLYRDSPSVLYLMLKKIYYMDRDSVDIGYHLFNQLIQTLDKYSLDKKLFLEMHQKIPYKKWNDIHILNNLYKNEISRLRVNHFFMKLELEQEDSSFYSYLSRLEDDLFVCNFRTVQFFFLNDYA